MITRTISVIYKNHIEMRNGMSYRDNDFWIPTKKHGIFSRDDNFSLSIFSRATMALLFFKIYKGSLLLARSMVLSKNVTQYSPGQVFLIITWKIERVVYACLDFVLLCSVSNENQPWEKINSSGCKQLIWSVLCDVYQRISHSMEIIILPFSMFTAM